VQIKLLKQTKPKIRMGERRYFKKYQLKYERIDLNYDILYNFLTI
jgi:hypothetical protein